MHKSPRLDMNSAQLTNIHQTKQDPAIGRISKDKH